MTLDDAIERLRKLVSVDGIGGRDAVAVRVLLDWVSERRPTMPPAIAGARRIHAGRFRVDSDGSTTETALCGGLVPREHPGGVVLDETPPFRPDDDNACQTCCRRLPPELRPAKPERPAHPPKPRSPFAGYEVDADYDDATEEVLIDLFKVNDSLDYSTVGQWVGPVPLDEIANKARAHRNKL